jgi:nitrogenase molybdenum-iron protein alpha/beta subunit
MGDEVHHSTEESIEERIEHILMQAQLLISDSHLLQANSKCENAYDLIISHSDGLNLAIPGSPLGQMGMMSGIQARNAQITQDAIQAQQLQQLMAMQAMRGQLPVGMMPQQQQG